MLYFADVPADTERIAFLGGVPADDVPQYWHRADGFDDTPMAHAESRQRVKFAREHVVAACADDRQVNSRPKNSIFVFIFSLMFRLYQKTKCGAKGKRILI